MPFWYSPYDASAFHSVPSLVQPVDFMNERENLRLGVYLSCVIVLFISVFYFVTFAVSFHGKCGLSWTGLTTSVECSIVDYASFIFKLTIFAIAVTAITFWPIALGILVLPPLIGYLLDRRKPVSV
jgi:hypothetical protein